MCRWASHNEIERWQNCDNFSSVTRILLWHRMTLHGIAFYCALCNATTRHKTERKAAAAKKNKRLQWVINNENISATLSLCFIFRFRGALDFYAAPFLCAAHRIASIARTEISRKHLFATTTVERAKNANVAFFAMSFVVGLLICCANNIVCKTGAHPASDAQGGRHSEIMYFNFFPSSRRAPS